MESRWIVVVVIIALLTGVVGGILGVSLVSGTMGMRMVMGSMMMPQMMMGTMRQMMADPGIRAQMLEMHRQMHDEMERR